jgi:hypothetical protein
MSCQVFYLEDHLSKSDIESLRDAKFNDFERIQTYSEKYFENIKRGDLVILERDRYRNDNVYIHDGNKLIDLSNHPDQYGNIPECFSVINEFPITYWGENIDHNTLVPFNHKHFISEILDNLSLFHQETNDETKLHTELRIKINDNKITYRPENSYMYILRSCVTVNENEYSLYYSFNSYFREYSLEELKELLSLLLNNTEYLYYDYDVSSLEDAFPDDLEYKENSIFCDIQLEPENTLDGCGSSYFGEYIFSEKNRTDIFDNLDDLVKAKLKKFNEES